MFAPKPRPRKYLRGRARFIRIRSTQKSQKWLRRRCKELTLKLKKVKMPIIRNVFPRLIAKDLCSVQPITEIVSNAMITLAKLDPPIILHF